jgi:hypothetical protein
MREHLGTAAMLLSIFVVVAMMFIGPKGFSFTSDKPIVTPVDEVAPAPLTGRFRPGAVSADLE